MTAIEPKHHNEPEHGPDYCPSCDKWTDEWWEHRMPREFAPATGQTVWMCTDCYWNASPHCIECEVQANNSREAMAIGNSETMNNDRWCCGTCYEGED